MTGTGEQEQGMVVAVVQHAAHENFRLIEDHDLDAVAANVAADFVNRRSADEPMAARTTGPEGMAATVAWLNRAFADIRFEIHETIVSGERVAVHVTMHATQHGPFVVHDSPDGAVTAYSPPEVARPPWTRPTGSPSRTARSPSTTRSATTWAWHSSSAGCRRTRHT